LLTTTPLNPISIAPRKQTTDSLNLQDFSGSGSLLLSSTGIKVVKVEVTHLANLAAKITPRAIPTSLVRWAFFFSGIKQAVCATLITVTPVTPVGPDASLDGAFRLAVITEAVNVSSAGNSAAIVTASGAIARGRIGGQAHGRSHRTSRVKDFSAFVGTN
jgi:hypothetical protein